MEARAVAGQERAAFLEKYRTSLAAHYGLMQPEYVVVPGALLAKTKELQRYFAISYAYVAAMKPKVNGQGGGEEASVSERNTRQ